MVEAGWAETERAGGRKRGMASQMGRDKTEGERETGPQSAPGLEVFCSFFVPFPGRMGEGVHWNKG